MLDKIFKTQMIGEHLADPAKSFYNVIYKGNLADFKVAALVENMCDRYTNQTLAKDINDGDHILLSCLDGAVIAKVVITEAVYSLKVCTYADIP